MNRLPAFLFTLLICIPLVPTAARQKSPLSLKDMFAIKRIADPALSPDGTRVVFTVTTPDLAANKTSSDLWIVPVSGGAPRRLTDHPAADRAAVWSPDGKWIAFESTRSGTGQIWLVSPEGGEPRQFTMVSTGAAGAVWSPDGSMIAYISEVFPEFSDRSAAESDTLNRRKLETMAGNKVQAKVYTTLLYRHWDSWSDGRRKHLFVQSVPGGDPRDLTPGDRDAAPVSMTFTAGIDYAFSPDGRELAYTAVPMPVREQAWSTNHDIYTIQVSGGVPRQITTNPGADGYPRYSPDGRFIVYRSQSTPGFEADRWRLILRDRAAGSETVLTEGFDGSVGSPVWSPDGTTLYFEAEEKGEEPIFAVSVKGREIRKVYSKGVNRNLSVSRDGRRLLYTNTTAVRPVEVFTIATEGGDATAVTDLNGELFSGLEIPPPEAVWFDGAGGTRIHAWLFKPWGFDPHKKYPFVYLVHGGPQNAWLNAWSFRWNPALWAAQGYIVMAPNPRGSTGFGQQFVNDITGDWGGKVFGDLMNGLEFAEGLPYVDRELKAAAGASYGGYMMNWFQAKAGGRFTTLVTHCGTFNFFSAWGTTEEVWFDEWERGGPPWENPAGYEEDSPHRYAKNFSTPNLVIHNALDFRVPFSEGMQLFTVLQRKGIDSKLVYFPDEGHWVLKPSNSEFWHTTVFDWLAKYLKPQK